MRIRAIVQAEVEGKVRNGSGFDFGLRRIEPGAGLEWASIVLKMVSMKGVLLISLPPKTERICAKPTLHAHALIPVAWGGGGGGGL